MAGFGASLVYGVTAHALQATLAPTSGRLGAIWRASLATYRVHASCLMPQSLSMRRMPQRGISGACWRCGRATTCGQGELLGAVILSQYLPQSGRWIFSARGRVFQSCWADGCAGNPVCCEGQHTSVHVTQPARGVQWCNAAVPQHCAARYSGCLLQVVSIVRDCCVMLPVAGTCGPPASSSAARSPTAAPRICTAAWRSWQQSLASSVKHVHGSRRAHGKQMQPTFMRL